MDKQFAIEQLLHCEASYKKAMLRLDIASKAVIQPDADEADFQEFHAAKKIWMIYSLAVGSWQKRAYPS